MDTSELVTVYTTNNAPEAEVIKNLLEAEQIQAVIANETQAGFTGILEIPILVRAENVERARELILSHGERGGAPDAERTAEEV